MAWIYRSLPLIFFGGWVLGKVQAEGLTPLFFKQRPQASSSTTMSTTNFKPALIVVDFQEDFCPPNGSLAVADGRTIAPIVNDLLDLPFALKVATKDFHPPNHISFAANHAPPDNAPFTSFTTIHNPYNFSETDYSRLWPVHCVQGTKGSELVPELNVSKVHRVIEKGTDARVEMYSAFEAPFRHPIVVEASSGLAQLLKEEGITDVYVVGLAMDYCVKFTAVDAIGYGFRTIVVREGTKAVDPSDAGWGEAEREMVGKGVSLVSVDGEEVNRVRDLCAT